MYSHQTFVGKKNSHVGWGLRTIVVLKPYQFVYPLTEETKHMTPFKRNKPIPYSKNILPMQVTMKQPRIAKLTSFKVSPVEKQPDDDVDFSFTNSDDTSSDNTPILEDKDDSLTRDWPLEYSLSPEEWEENLDDHECEESNMEYYRNDIYVENDIDSCFHDFQFT
ncbi:hypothetical protein TRFO_37134 [Tritrichomonas foetus]|uniref:Uncharacterized protein n=1 Tax=Tritrichomonas foetus TaxID=1144522 RepID=A0A1J4JBS4_9EUKA|nr:hypothetical protein TRFO_37134 [Tritrichomonas foetus]|eukprot:OHS96638.1 hypothetical protein TRFO_37134 [Tritrichomonas foetus]